MDRLYLVNGNIKDTIEYYKNNDLFTLLFDEKYEIFEKLIDWEKQSTELLKQIEFFKKRKQTYLYLYSLDKSNLTNKLKELCDINPETMKTGKYTEINYIDISSVKEGKLLEIKNLKGEFPSRAKRIIKQGDILYSSVRPNLKGYVYINNSIENQIYFVK